MNGPKGLKQIPYLMEMAKDYVSSYYHLFEDFGPIVTLSLPWKMHIVTDPEIFEKVLSKDFQNYTISNLTQDLKPLLGEGVITSDGDQWSQNKRLVWPFFSLQNVQGFEAIIHKQILYLLGRFPKQEQFEFDPANLVFEMTYQVISNLIFSKNIDANSYAMEKAITTCVQIVQKKQAAIIKFPYWVPTPSNFKFNRSRKLIKKILDDEISERILLKSEQKDLLNIFLKSENTSVVNLQNVKDQIITLFITGHETTANTIMWSLYLLSTHPEIYAKWLEEIRQHDKSIPSIGDMDQYPLTNAIIKETMRLYPAAPVIPRRAIASDSFQGTQIDVGDEVLLSIYNMHRNPKFWENPHSFEPRRFLDENKIPLYQYLPFGRGKRACIGERLAMTETVLLLITLGRNFDFKYHGPQINHLSRLTLRQDKPLRMSFKRV